MRRWLRQRPGELYILIIGLVMFAGAIFAASYHPQPPGALPPSAQAEQIQQQSPGAPASAPVSAAQTQEPSGAAPAPASAPASTAQNTVQPNAPADSSAGQTAQAQ